MRGILRRSWMLVAVASAVAFASNSAVQLLFTGEADLPRALVIGVSLGLVIGAMDSLDRKRKARNAS